MVMGDRAAAANDRIARRLLDSMPLRLQLAVPPQCMKREIGRRTVGIDMRETAGDLARPAGHLADARSGRFLDGIMTSKRSQVIAVSKVSEMMARLISGSRA